MLNEYLPDFTQIFPSRDNVKQYLAIGWLDAQHPFPTGSVLPECWARLMYFCQFPLFVLRSIAICPFGGRKCAPDMHIRVPWEGNELSVRNARIYVLGSADHVYVAPHMICHFIHAHQYLPPDVFLQAVMESPLPDSPEYLAVQQQEGWH